MTRGIVAIRATALRLAITGAGVGAATGALRALLLALGLACAGQAHAAPPHARDPFQAPTARPTAGAAAGSGSAGTAFASPAMSGGSAATGQAAAAPAAGELQLDAVIYDGAQSLANLGGRIVAVGDVVDGYQVAAIGVRSVLLRQGARRLTLTMKQKAPR